jgi:mono/diheme cytochrome c family protein
MTRYPSNELSAGCIRRLRTVKKVFAAAGLVALFWLPVHAAQAQQAKDDVIEMGRQQFAQRCAVCHGPEGTGNGVLGPHLKAQPADLTRLSAANGGTFPFWETYSNIDGREIVSTHGTSDMPVWGTDEQFEGSGGRLAMGQILEIVFFLQSIQKE